MKKTLLFFVLLTPFFVGCSISVQPITEPVPIEEPKEFSYGVWSGFVYLNSFYQGEIFVNYNKKEWMYCEPINLCDYGTTNGWYLMDNGNIDFYVYPNYEEETLHVVRRLNQGITGTMHPVKHMYLKE